MNSHYDPITLEDVSDADTLLYIIRLALGVAVLSVLGVAFVLGVM